MPRRCAYRDSRNRACGKAGSGNPPLCQHHAALLEDEVEFNPLDSPVFDAVVGRVMEHPRVGGALDSLGGAFDRFAKFVDRVASNDPQEQEAAFADARAAGQRFNAWRAQRQAKAQQRPRQAPPPRRPPPPPPKPPSPMDDPRVVMGFAPGVKLTKAMVKERQRELAKIHHPDRGGHPEAMKRLNVAADALLKEIAT